MGGVLASNSSPLNSYFEKYTHWLLFVHKFGSWMSLEAFITVQRKDDSGLDTGGGIWDGEKRP